MKRPKIEVFEASELAKHGASDGLGARPADRQTTYAWRANGGRQSSEHGL